MKKLALFIITISCFLCITETKAGCLFSDCPSEKVHCPKGEFMGDDGKCYSCDIDKEIWAHCLEFEELEKICPNRVRGYCGISYLKCPAHHELVGKYCEYECPAGYVRDNEKYKDIGYNTACCNDEGCLIDHH